MTLTSLSGRGYHVPVSKRSKTGKGKGRAEEENSMEVNDRGIENVPPSTKMKEAGEYFCQRKLS